MPLPRAEVERLKAEMRARAPAPEIRIAKGVPRGVAVGLGLTDVDDEYRVAVRVADEETKQWFERTYADLIETLKDDIDIQVIGPPLPLPEPIEVFASRPRLAIGMGIRHARGRAGTLGFFARRNGTPGFVSCNHVIALRDLAEEGDVIQSEAGRHEIGTLHFVHWLTSASRPLADCAFASVSKDLYPRRPGHIDGIGNLVNLLPRLTRRTKVWKIGRTTRRTRGTISNTDFDGLDANFNGDFIAKFDNVIEVESDEPRTRDNEIPAFARGGDSGALVWTNDFKPVGMVFYETGGGPRNSGRVYVHPIRIVEKALGVRIDTRS